MQLGMIGLGRMGANMTERLIGRGHELVVTDHDPGAVASDSLSTAPPEQTISPGSSRPSLHRGRSG